jgi:uncharacterized protein
MMASANQTASDLPWLWWNGGDAFRSRLFDAISLLLPSGERFVIAAISDWLQLPAADSLTSALQRDALKFIKEEQAHSRAHHLYNDRLAVHAPAQRLEQRIAAAMQPMSTWTLSSRIAFAAAFEELTALLSVEVLRPRNAWLDSNATPQAKLWRWHCEEEIHHRHVAPEVARAMGVGRCRSALVFIVAASYLCADVVVTLATLLLADKRAQRVGLTLLTLQAIGFTLQVTPSLLRMAGASLYSLIKNR